MRTDVIFRDIKMFDHLRDFVEQSAEDSTADFDRRDFHTVVIVSKTAPRTETHGPMFKCTVLVRAKSLRSPLFVKKEDGDFHTVVREALSVIRNKLRQLAHKRIPQRRIAAEFEEQMAAQ